MEILKITDNKEMYVDLLLLADEQIELIEAYLYEGDMFALYEQELVGVSIVIKREEFVYEIKNLAINTKFQGMGYGKKLIHFICQQYPSCLMYVGTGEVPKTLKFYEHCGFKRDHIIKNFFLDHYDHIMIEDGITLKDMIYLKKEL